MDRPLRVLTLNCWNVSAPFDERMALIRDGITALQPDLIGLQEIVVRRDGFDQGAIILRDLGYEWTFGAAFRWNETEAMLPPDADGDAFGNLVASRWPIARCTVRPLPGAQTGERRSALGTVIAAPFGMIPFCTTHFNWKLDHGSVREQQALAVADFLGEWCEGATFPPILVGDFNAEPEATEIRFLCGLTSLSGRSTYFQDAWRVAANGGLGFSWDTRNPFAAYSFDPNRRIDYIFVGLPDATGRGYVEHARLVLDQPGRGAETVFPSDHFGVLAEIRL